MSKALMKSLAGHVAPLGMSAHIPLTEANVCLDCEVVFNSTLGDCPACGAITVFLLSNWVKPIGLKREISLAQEVVRGT